MSLKIDTEARIERVRFQNQTGSFAGAPADGYSWLYVQDTGTVHGGLFMEKETGVFFGPYTATPMYEAYMKCSDTKAQGTPAGAFTQDAWRTRDITTEDEDTDGNLSISSNQMTLNAGTYRIRASAPAALVTFHQSRLYNISDSSVTILGSSEYANDTHFVANHSHIVGRFTIASLKVFEIQHYCKATKADDGFGIQMNIASEIYTTVEFWKEA